MLWRLKMAKQEEGYCDICNEFAMCSETEDGEFLCDECLEPGSSNFVEKVVSLEDVNYLDDQEELNYG
jgi:hypothetical protein